ncbi:MAG: hypothetical protein HUU50_09925 [Candidatus Brocadiae bacterium]|nr:hypothetical protein [Candidatus Brocadiia bacterium]
MDQKILFLVCMVLCLLFFPCCKEETAAVEEKAQEEMLPFDEENVSAEAGGPGFSGIDWEDNRHCEVFSNPNAQKGGSLRVCIPAFPRTLRTTGKDSNFTINGIMREMLYESLLKLHPNHLEFIPSLATHWQILRDSKTFRFRLNPKARWSDGTPITTRDVIATWQLLIDPKIESPYINQIFLRYHKPVAESKYIIHVTAKELNWQLFLNFAAMTLYPAHILKNMDGSGFLAEYDSKAIVGSGAYEMLLDGIQAKQKLIFQRRKDYWGEKERFNQNLHNFDKIEFLVEADEQKAFDRFKKGDFDIYEVHVAKRWVQETDFEEVKRGLIQKRKIYNQQPQGYSGIAFNMRRPPFDKLQVRSAFALLFNRDKFIEDFFFNEYEPLDSYFPGSIYANPKNPRYRYDFEKAVSLLKDAGWEQKNQEGWLVKDGKILETTLFCPPSLKPLLEKIYQVDLNKAGVKIHFADSKPEITAKREFDMIFVSWSGLAFPNPESSWASNLADIPSNNVSGLKVEKVDRICEAYRRMFLQRQRVEALNELDAILMEQHPYALGWGINCRRLMFWNKFDYPEHYLSKTGSFWEVLSLWSCSEEKEKNVISALSNKESMLPVGETNQVHWRKK